MHFRWADAWFSRDGGSPIDYLDLQQNKIGQAIHAIKREARYLFAADADLSGLDLIILPLGLQFDAAWEEKLATWVKQGGQILTMPLFGAKDDWNAYLPSYRSATMQELTGTTVKRRIPIRDGHHTTASLQGELLSPELRLEELVISDEAEAVANFTAEPFDGAPFLVSHPIEQGRAWTIAGYLNGKDFAVVLRHILDEPPACCHSPFVQICFRLKRLQKYVNSLDHLARHCANNCWRLLGIDLRVSGK